MINTHQNCHQLHIISQKQKQFKKLKTQTNLLYFWTFTEMYVQILYWKTGMDHLTRVYELLFVKNILRRHSMTQENVFDKQWT